MRQRFGEMLVGAGVITEQQLEYALEKQRQTGKPLGGLLIELGYITKEELGEFLQRFWGARSVDFSSRKIPPEVLLSVPYEFCRKHSIVPVEATDSKAVVACVDPTKVDPAELGELLNREVEVVVAPANQVENLLENYERILYESVDFDFFLRGLNEKHILYILPDSSPAISDGTHTAYMNLPPVSPSTLVKLLNRLRSAMGSGGPVFVYETPSGGFKITATEHGIVARRLSLRPVRIPDNIENGMYFICGNDCSGRTSVVVLAAERLCRNGRVLIIGDLDEYPQKDGVIIKMICDVGEISEKIRIVPYLYVDAVLVDCNRLFLYEGFYGVLNRLLTLAASGKIVFVTLPSLNQRQRTELEQMCRDRGVRSAFIFCT